MVEESFVPQHMYLTAAHAALIANILGPFPDLICLSHPSLLIGQLILHKGHDPWGHRVSSQSPKLLEELLLVSCFKGKSVAVEVTISRVLCPSE